MWWGLPCSTDCGSGVPENLPCTATTDRVCASNHPLSRMCLPDPSSSMHAVFELSKKKKTIWEIFQIENFCTSSSFCFFCFVGRCASLMNAHERIFIFALICEGNFLLFGYIPKKWSKWSLKMNKPKRLMNFFFLHKINWFLC